LIKGVKDVGKSVCPDEDIPESLRESAAIAAPTLRPITAGGVEPTHIYAAPYRVPACSVYSAGYPPAVANDRVYAVFVAVKSVVSLAVRATSVAVPPSVGYVYRPILASVPPTRTAPPVLDMVI
jgi:hypothetical protein